MTQDEKNCRRAIWDKMTPEERQEAEARKAEIIEWSIKENEKAIEKIKAEGRWVGGLDGSYPELDEINKEYRRKLNELLEDCGLGPVDFK